MPRFADTVTANASVKKAWETLQDAGVWGALLGAAEISDIEVEDGLLKSCTWKAKIGGSELTGTMKVAESEPRERMLMKVRAAEWRGKIEMTLEPEHQRKTRLHARLELSADGFTAMLALPDRLQRDRPPPPRPNGRTSGVRGIGLAADCHPSPVNGHLSTAGRLCQSPSEAGGWGISCRRPMADSR